MRVAEITFTSERPRERLIKNGPQSLSVRELIAIVFGSGPKGKGCLGLADQLLGKGVFSGDDGLRALAESLKNHESFMTRPVSGLGEARKCKLIAAFELGARLHTLQDNLERATRAELDLNDLESACYARVPRTLRYAKKEWLGFVPVYRSGKAGQLVLIKQGQNESVAFDVRELFTHILILKPLAFLLVHNHPSGLMRASTADCALTIEVRELAERLNTVLLGHMIVNREAKMLVTEQPDSPQCSTRSNSRRGHNYEYRSNSSYR